jgi:outer membrane autotransporter protein
VERSPWYGNNGFYLDGQAQLAWWTSDLGSKIAGRTLIGGNDAFGYGLSVETGQRLAIDETWSVTPQAQLNYTGVNFESFNDAFEAKIRNDGADSLIGRLGFAVDRETSWMDNRSRPARAPYCIVNINYEFLNGSSVQVSGTQLHPRSIVCRQASGLGVPLIGTTTDIPSMVKSRLIPV